MDYIQEHYTQAIALPEDPINWHSGHANGGRAVMTTAGYLASRTRP
jgi:hypothetical protein